MSDEIKKPNNSTIVRVEVTNDQLISEPGANIEVHSFDIKTTEVPTVESKIKTPPRKVPTKDDFYMGMAFASSEESKDPNTQVGAFIVAPDNEPLGYGFNGPPRSVDDDAMDWSRPAKYFKIVHAEINAIRHSRREQLKGSTIYVTAMPCKDCILDIANYGISKVVYADMKINDPNSSLTLNNDDKKCKTLEIAEDTGVEVVKYTGSLNWLEKVVSRAKQQGLIHEEQLD